MATTGDIEALKENWRNDPCWAIETTEGFEQHREELLDYRLEQEKKCEAWRYEKLQEKSRRMGIPGNMELTQYIENLEYQIQQLWKAIEKG